jgi:hypothetical protein
MITVIGEGKSHAGACRTKWIVSIADTNDLQA